MIKLAKLLNYTYTKGTLEIIILCAWGLLMSSVLVTLGSKEFRIVTNVWLLSME